ncbi:hypothetical protein [Nostoc sp.]|nr:hypothetical protein [Nostoc sp. JL34]
MKHYYYYPGLFEPYKYLYQLAGVSKHDMQPLWAVASVKTTLKNPYLT